MCTSILLQQTLEKDSGKVQISKYSIIAEKVHWKVHLYKYSTTTRTKSTPEKVRHLKYSITTRVKTPRKAHLYKYCSTTGAKSNMEKYTFTSTSIL